MTFCLKDEPGTIGGYIVTDDKADTVGRYLQVNVFAFERSQDETGGWHMRLVAHDATTQSAAETVQRALNGSDV